MGSQTNIENPETIDLNKIQQQDFDETCGNSLFFGANLPKGIGRNGIVFETKRPDDPEKFSLRYQDTINERQKIIDDDFHQKKLEEIQVNEELRRKEQLLQSLQNDTSEIKRVIQEMNEDLNEMSQYQVY